VSDTVEFEIAPREVKQLLESGHPLFLIDVRRPEEHQICHLDGAELIPMDTIPRHLDRLEELSESATVIVFCHHGVRSANVVNWLRGQGIPACQSMAGGIDRWSTDVDPAVPRY
jgi:adenylyltransferase/sulfurtransferase